jgi:DNA polymerase III delta prime subunit
MRWDIEYSPTNFDDMALYPQLREYLSYYYESGNIPHVIFHGDTGTGKSTSAFILARVIKPGFSQLNVFDCAGEKSAKSVEGYITSLKGATGALTRFMDNTHQRRPPYVFIFDEFHNIDKKHQTMLNLVLGNEAGNIPCFFCVNNIEKVAEPIQSRARILRFDVAAVSNDKLVMRDVGMTANEWKEELRRVGRIITKKVGCDIDEKIEDEVLSNDVNCVDARKFIFSLGERYEMKMFRAKSKEK